MTDNRVVWALTLPNVNPVFLFVPRLTCEGEGGGWGGLNLEWPGEMLLEIEDWEGEDGRGQEGREEEGR